MSLALGIFGLAAYVAARQVNVTIDAGHVEGDLPPVARFFGADEPNQGMWLQRW